jgi:hypothetical protein
MVPISSMMEIYGMVLPLIFSSVTACRLHRSKIWSAAAYLLSLLLESGRIHLKAAASKLPHSKKIGFISYLFLRFQEVKDEKWYLAMGYVDDTLCAHKCFMCRRKELIGC